MRPLLAGVLFLFSTIFSPATQAGHGDDPLREEARMLLEQLIRLADTLQTEVNLSRASGFVLQPIGRVAMPVPAPIVNHLRPGTWEHGFFHQVLLVGLRPNETIDYAVSTQIHRFRLQAIQMYDYWTLHGRPGAEINRQWIALNHSFYNAMAAIRWYIESLRRSYLIRGCFFDQMRIGRPGLIQRLNAMRFLSNQIFELMIAIQRREALRLAVMPAPIWVWGPIPFEFRFEHHEVHAYQPFPYYVPRIEGEGMVDWYAGQLTRDFVPARPYIPEPEFRNYTPRYDAQWWQNQWNFYDRTPRMPQSDYTPYGNGNPDLGGPSSGGYYGVPGPGTTGRGSYPSAPPAPGYGGSQPQQPQPETQGPVYGPAYR